jgi:eukaryotic-like serine/threonine-protein kinase
MERASPGSTGAPEGRLQSATTVIDSAAPDLTLLRTRRGLVFLSAFCMTAIPLDLAVAYSESGPWQVPVAVRIVQCLACLALVAGLHARPVKGDALLRLERVTTPGLAVLLVIPALALNGISSIYGLSPVFVLVGRAAMRADPWRAALPTGLLTIASAPAVFAVASVFSPKIAAQWTDPSALTYLFSYVLATASVVVVTLWTGQTTHTLQTQLFEARQIGRYKLRRLLGAGGMGEVWAAYFPALKREVAVKILRLADEDAVARFEREVRATAELTHPNTVRVFDFGRTDDGLWYYAMEKLEGESLAALIRREGPLAPARARHFLLQAARALAEAHARGIIHRDIKPENLFVANQGGERDFLKVLDFGIAKTSDPGTLLKTTGAIQGTPGYIAPEILRGHRADPRADIYALGATGYAMLTGAPPFSGKTLAATLEATLRGQPLSPSERLGQPLPADLEAVVLRCLEPDPEARFSSAEELAAALAACAEVGDWSPNLAPAEPEEFRTAATPTELAGAATIRVTSSKVEP